VTSFSENSENIGNFDIANVEVMGPPAGVTVFLPYSFEWMLRYATLSTDRFRFILWDPYGNSEFVSPLIDTFMYQLTQLPPGFVTNKYYAWTVEIVAPDGGYGLSFYAYAVAFMNSGSAQPYSMPTEPQQKSSLWMNSLDPRWSP
jgi:hypothetical protein